MPHLCTNVSPKYVHEMMWQEVDRVLVAEKYPTVLDWHRMWLGKQYITTQQQQDAAALRALELSGMKYDDVRSALKKQYDLPQLVTILGHAVRNGPR